MKRCIPQQWLQLFAASQGAISCSSSWLGAGTRLDSWRCLSVQQAIGAQSLERTSEAINEASPSLTGAALAFRDSQQEALRARALLERFMESFDTTPPASFIRSVGVPTAMSWMRRRGPDVPHAVLYRLFRQRQIRLFDGETVRRASASRALHPGDLLLYPNWLKPSKQHHQPPRNQIQIQHLQHQKQLAGRRDAAARAAAAIAAAAAVRRTDLEDGDGAAAGAAAAAGEDRYYDVDHGTNRQQPQSASLLPPRRRPQHPLELSPERVRRWVLGVHPGLLFLNKPAGVRVHGMAAGDEASRGGGRSVGRSAGGGGMRPPVPVTLDDVMQEGLRFGQWDEPRLVHRLDQAASGVMVVARNADAATWLCAAFMDKAKQALAGERRGRGDRDPEDRGEEEGGFGSDGGDSRRGRAGRTGPLLLLRGEEERPSIHRTYWAFLAGDLQPRQSGRISLPVVVDGVLCPAVTTYRVKATGCGVSWVELTPETGRRHQLRVHCARKLGAPIVGDMRYGYRGLPPRLALRDHLPPEWWALLGDDPRVVRRSREAAGEADPLSAPVLLHSRELVVKRPGKAALGGVAPVPRYIRQLIEAAGWPVPSLG